MEVWWREALPRRARRSTFELWWFTDHGFIMRPAWSDGIEGHSA